MKAPNLHAAALTCWNGNVNWEYKTNGSYATRGKELGTKLIEREERSVDNGGGLNTMEWKDSDGDILLFAPFCNTVC